MPLTGVQGRSVLASFVIAGYGLVWEPTPSRQADPDNFRDALAFALTLDGRRRGMFTMKRPTQRGLLRHRERGEVARLPSRAA